MESKPLQAAPPPFNPRSFLEANRLLRMDEVCLVLDVERTTVYKWIREGKFPEPLRLSPRCSRWRAADVLGYLAAVGGKGA